MKDLWLTKTLGFTMTVFIVALLVVPELAAIPIHFQRGFALLLALVLGVLYKPTESIRWPVLARLYDILIILLSVAAFGYLMINSAVIVDRIGMANVYDVVFSTIGFIVVLEVARRWTPPALMIMVLAFAAYVFVGPFIPHPVLSHPRISWEHFVTYTMISQEGILGVGVALVVNVIFIFMVLSAAMKLTGIGDFIMNISLALVGRYTGGPALTAVASSSMFGMVSGSPVANVATTGTITIPLMIKQGYPPRFAGAVEAAASTGGQIMPPILGSVAFFISEVTGTPYLKIATMALIPALIYYGSVATTVILESYKQGLRGLPKAEVPSALAVMKAGWYCMLPIVILLGFLFMGYTPQKAAWNAIIITVIIGVLKKVGWKEFFGATVEAARASLTVITAVAAIGIVVASLAITGLAPKVAALIVYLGAGNWMLGMLVIAIFGIILGLGLPPLPTYIIMYVATVRLIPHFEVLGFSALAIYMFMFYYAAMAPVTPPGAVTAFTAAAIAKTDPFALGWKAFGMALAGFTVPYLFVQHEQLLLMGDIWPGIIVPLLMGIVLIAGGSMATAGWFITPLDPIRRLIAAAATVVVILPTDWAFPVAFSMILLVVFSAIFAGSISTIYKQYKMNNMR